MHDLQANVQHVLADLAANARDRAAPPRLLAVTKTQPAQRILPLLALGVHAIGENRPQEIVEKAPFLSKDFDIHLIGQLQSNKVKYIIGRVCLIHSLDRLTLARAIDTHARSLGLCQDVLVEVNISGEASKSGLAPAEVLPFLRTVSPLPGLAVRGLMTVMPNAPDPETLRPLFRAMRILFDGLRETAVNGVSMQELSMGMSNDYRVAVQEGATLVRIGSALFGARS